MKVPVYLIENDDGAFQSQNDPEPRPHLGLTIAGPFGQQIGFDADLFGQSSA
jgi:hypothetical protein